MADQEIKTTIDALVSYITAHGETNITAVSSALGVGEQTIIEWSNILEKANMIKIVYRSGKMFLSPLAEGGESIEQIKQQQQAERSQVEAELSSQAAVVEQVSAKIADFNKSLTEIDKVFNTRYKDIKTVLDRISAIENEMASADKKISSKSAEIANINKKLREDFEGVQKYSIDLAKFNLDTNNARNVATDIKNRITTYKENIKAMGSEIDKVINERRKNAVSIVNSMRDDIRELEQIFNYDEKQISEYEANEKNYKREAESSLKRVEKTRVQTMDELVKSSQKVQRLIDLSDKQAGELKAKMDVLKKEIGTASDLNDKLNSIRKDLAEAQKIKEGLSKELNTMLQESRALGGGADRSKTPDKALSVDKLHKKAKKSSETIRKLQESAEKVNQGLKDLGK